MARTTANGAFITGTSSCSSSGSWADPDTAAMIAFEQRMYDDPVFNRWFEEGDRARAHQTAHDKNHGIDVRTGSDYVMRAYVRHCERIHRPRPTRMARSVVAITGYTHDIGSVAGEVEHEEVGARMQYERLHIQLGLPLAPVEHICGVTRRHRSASVLRDGIFSAEHAIVVIADKARGDETRVRPEVRDRLEQLRRIDAVSSYRGLRGEDPRYLHDVINFAIKQARLFADAEDGAGSNSSALTLQIRLDEQAATCGEVLSLFDTRYRALNVAAQYLGMVFRMEFLLEEESKRFYFNAYQQAWKEIAPHGLPVG